MKNYSNNVTIAGEVRTNPETYNCCGENFYSFSVAVKRDSGVEDIIPVNVSHVLIKNVKVGDKVCLVGQIRTYNKSQDGKSRLIIILFVQSVKEYINDLNEVELTGYFCKNPVYRTTPLGRDICDIILAVNRERRKSDYVPCIVWGRTAALISNLNVGAKVNVQGRFQSRVYEKKTDDGNKKFTAYEVSINRIQEALEEVVV